MPNDDRMTPAPVGSREGHDLQLNDGGVIMPSVLGDMIDFAKIMCKSDVAIPKHLRGNPGACLSVAMRARAWRFDPFAVATKTYAVNDILAYESQLINAVINRHAPIHGRLVPRYSGMGDTRQCIIEATDNDGQVLIYESPRIKDISPKNSPLWKSDPDQQLFYYSSRAWSRRYFPELLLGVYDVEEARGMKDVTPAEPQKVDNFLNDEEEPARTSQPVEGEVYIDNKRVSIDQETGEITDVEVVEEKPEPIDPSIIAKNMAKAAKGFSSLTMLEAWAEESKADIAALPEENRAAIEKLIAVRRVELGEL